MKIYLSIFFISLFFIGSAAAQQKFAPTNASRNQAIAVGQGQQFIAAMEALGAEAESKERWVQAAVAYHQASTMAWLTGQLQKAIADATKSLHAAQRGKNPTREVYAMMSLATAYGDVRQPEKAKELLDKALEIAKTVKGDRQVLEANLYVALGEHYLRERDRKQAIDNLTNALALWEARQTALKFTPGRPNTRLELESVQDRILLTRQRLGGAYLGIGNAQEAIKILEPAIALLEETAITTSIDEVLVSSLGRAYAAQKEFPRALDYLTKALEKAEARQHQSAIPSISTSIGQIFVRTGKPAQAVPYYKKAIDSIESTRSFLQSEELRTSFFENKGQTYGQIIQASIRAKNFEDAFNYNERARSRAFLDILGSKVRLGKQSALVEEENALQSKIHQLKATVGRRAGIDEESEVAKDRGAQK